MKFVDACEGGDSLLHAPLLMADGVRGGGGSPLTPVMMADGVRESKNDEDDGPCTASGWRDPAARPGGDGG